MPTVLFLINSEKIRQYTGVLADVNSILDSPWSFIYVFLLFLTQDKLDKELEAVRAEQIRAAIQAAADRQLADAQQQVQGESKLVCSYQQSHKVLYSVIYCCSNPLGSEDD